MQAPIEPSSSTTLRRTFALAGAAVVVFAGCSGTTPEQRLRLRTEVTLHGSPTFENAMGWHVEVQDAWLSIGSLRLLEGAPLGSLKQPRPSWTDLLVKTAHAHPGHYQEGAVLAEMLAPSSVDLQAITELAPAEALSGEPLSGQIVLASPAVGPHSEVLGDGIVRVHGVAERTNSEGVTERRHFQATTTGAELGSTSTPPAGTGVEITGCPYEGGRLAEGATVRLEVDVALWFDQVDFQGLEASTSETSPAPLATDDRANNGFLRGLAKAAAYRFDVPTEP